ncbi:MAG TPA: hypothetical protein VIT45_17810 [Allosphingosinicella sp.]
MALEIFVPLGAFAMIVVALSLITRLIATAILNRTIREAIRSDPASVPLLAARLEQRQPWADELLGWILLAFAAGIVLIGFLGQDYDRREIFQAAIIPALIGIVVLVYCRLMAPRTRTAPPPSS